MKGFPKVMPQVGCLVALPGTQEVADFLPVLALFEGTCVEMAAERATDQSVDGLKRLVTEIMAVDDGQLDAEQLAHAFRLHDRVVHQRLYSIAHSDIVSSLVVGPSDRADLYIANAFGAHSFSFRFHHALEEHRRIADVLSWRDPAAGRRVIKSHLVSFIDALGSAAQDGEQGIR